MMMPSHHQGGRTKPSGKPGGTFSLCWSSAFATDCFAAAATCAADRDVGPAMTMSPLVDGRIAVIGTAGEHATTNVSCLSRRYHYASTGTQKSRRPGRARRLLVEHMKRKIPSLAGLAATYSRAS